MVSEQARNWNKQAKRIRNLAMAKHRGESSKMGQAGPLPQAAVSGLQVQTHSQTAGATHEEHDSEHD
ncbi:hypothetical protein BHE74_00051276 [Ensete ventricosum]|nr:hypothetical protein BHE74_00051276 [Ensete ventricosum]